MLIYLKPWHSTSIPKNQNKSNIPPNKNNQTKNIKRPQDKMKQNQETKYLKPYFGVQNANSTQVLALARPLVEGSYGPSGPRRYKQGRQLFPRRLVKTSKALAVLTKLEMTT